MNEIKSLVNWLRKSFIPLSGFSCASLPLHRLFFVDVLFCSACFALGLALRFDSRIIVRNFLPDLEKSTAYCERARARNFFFSAVRKKGLMAEAESFVEQFNFHACVCALGASGYNT